MPKSLRLCNRHPQAYEPPMPVTPDELFAYLDSLGIAHKSVSHQPLFTVEESRAWRGKIPGAHTKNLLLRDKKGTVFLVVALEDAVIELRSLHRLLGASGRFSFGSADLMRELIGVEPGSVTPFAAINDKGSRVTVVLDAALMAHAVLNFHPLVNTATTTISREGLLKFLEATGHKPRIEPVSADPSS
jgi:Ala-tRNA(Pro) deacylase